MSDAISAARAVALIRESGNPIDFELVLAANYRKLVGRGDVVIDIGAHAGQHLKQFLELVTPEGRVAGVEPLPKLYHHLTQAFGALPNLELHNFALSDQGGTAIFNVATNSLAESGLRKKVYSIPDIQIEQITVEVRTVDGTFMDLPSVTFVKIDVEGAEIDLLRGATAFLRKYRPYLSIEYGAPSYAAYGNDKRTLFDLADANGYVCADLYGNIIDEVDEWTRLCDWAYWDFLLVPLEKRVHFESLFTR